MSLCFITFSLRFTHTSLEMLGGRPWLSHSRLVPIPTRKQLIMCERLSEYLLSGQQHRSAINLPSRQDSQPAHHAGMQTCILSLYSHTHTHTHKHAQMWKTTKDEHSSMHTHTRVCKIKIHTHRKHINASAWTHQRADVIYIWQSRCRNRDT